MPIIKYTTLEQKRIGQAASVARSNQRRSLFTLADKLAEIAPHEAEFVAMYKEITLIHARAEAKLDRLFYTYRIKRPQLEAFDWSNPQKEKANKQRRDRYRMKKGAAFERSVIQQEHNIPKTILQASVLGDALKSNQDVEAEDKARLAALAATIKKEK